MEEVAKPQVRIGVSGHPSELVLWARKPKSCTSVSESIPRGGGLPTRTSDVLIMLAASRVGRARTTTWGILPWSTRQSAT